MAYPVGHNFEGAARLTAVQANSAMSALAAAINRDPSAWGLEQQVRVVHTGRPVVTVTGFDAMAVDQLGLADLAAHVQQVTAEIGLKPPAFYGTEVVARFLGLRHEQPVPAEQFDLFPTDPITRAEAAWSLAQILDIGSGSVSYARQTLTTYQLPTMNPDQLTALRIAISPIGYPYIWGGTTDNTADGLPHGGYDCSGFVWRVYKISGLPGASRSTAAPPRRWPARSRAASASAPRSFSRATSCSSAARTSTAPRPSRTSPRRHLPRRQLGDQLLRPGRVCAAAEGKLARRPVRVGTSGPALT